MLSRRQKLTQVLIKFNLVKVKAQQKGKRLTDDVIKSPRKLFFPLLLGDIMKRDLAMAFSRVTEGAALAGYKWLGRGDKNAADGACLLYTSPSPRDY